jgi:hypothetical protein
MLFRTKIRRGPDGAVHVDLDEEERGLLRQVADELRDLLTEEPEDPSLRRLFPTAHEDPEREGEYRELTRNQLVTGRQRSLEVLESTADSRVLTPEEADAWLRALNDARLVLGTRLDITEDYDWDALDTTTPRAPELALYAYLSWLQEQLVEAL